MAQSAADIKKEMLDLKIVDDEQALEWLTDEYIKDRESREKDLSPTADSDGKALSYTDYGNHFYTTNGGSVWHWESGKNTPGGNLACGRVDAWRYNRRVGDSYAQAGNCSGGYPYWRLEIYH